MRTPRLAMAAATLAAFVTTSLPLAAAPPAAPVTPKIPAAPITPKISVVAIYDFPSGQYGLPAGTSTIGRGISNLGDIAGYVQNGSDQWAFIRSANGTFSAPFVDPADTTGKTTFAFGINVPGTIVGAYLDSNGFMLHNGTYTNSTNEQLYAINDVGEMCGSGNGLNANAPIPGLVVSGKQQTTFLAPGATGPASQTAAEAINNFAAVAGSFTIDGLTYNGFFRVANGNIIVISYPTASQTLVHGLNDQGWLCGHYIDPQSVDHAFLLIDGKYESYDLPGAIGTSFNGINNAGDISGRYTTADGVWHGLILKVTP
jgi:hypothetical protein